MKTEIRFGIPAEIRADDPDKPIRVEGHAAVFNQRANIGDMFEEMFVPGAFREAIKDDDVVFLVNHEGLPLGRTRSGTLDLAEDKTGLRIRAELERTDPDVAAIVPKMQRGDLDKMSIAFRAEVQEWDDSGKIPLRTITRARLFDVSIVTNPAYSGTDIALRSLEQHQRGVNFAAANRRINARARRMRLDLAQRGIGRENG